MDIARFIAKRLNTEKKVCIPGLGTLSATGDTAGPKESDSENNTFFPFLSGLEFSEEYDAADKSLAGMLAGERQINANMAGYEVDKFVIRVKQELSRNGRFELPEVGELKTGTGGKVLFESSLRDRSLFGLSPIELHPVAQGDVVTEISRKIGFKSVRKNKFKLIWAILIGLIILGLVSLLLVRLNIIGI